MGRTHARDRCRLRASQVKKIIQRTNRQSLIIIIIAIVIGASTLLMGGIGFATFFQDLRAGEDQGLRELCVAEAPDR